MQQFENSVGPMPELNIAMMNSEAEAHPLRDNTVIQDQLQYLEKLQSEHVNKPTDDTKLPIIDMKDKEEQLSTLASDEMKSAMRSQYRDALLHQFAKQTYRKVEVLGPNLERPPDTDEYPDITTFEPNFELDPYCPNCDMHYNFGKRWPVRLPCGDNVCAKCFAMRGPFPAHITI